MLCMDAQRPLHQGGTLVVLESPKHGDARSMGYLLRIQPRCETNPRNKYEVKKLKTVGNLKSALPSDMKMQNLLVFSLALVQYFLIMLPFLSFGMVMCILCHYILEVWDFFFYLQGDTVKRQSWVSKETLDV